MNIFVLHRQRRLAFVGVVTNKNRHVMRLWAHLAPSLSTIIGLLETTPTRAGLKNSAETLLHKHYSVS